MVANIRMIYVGFCLSLLAVMLSSCAIQSPILNRYQLRVFAKMATAPNKKQVSILISQPTTMAGYDTEAMLYVTKPYHLTEFANNSWSTTPAHMLFPLIIQSIESSHYFYVVASDPNVAKTDYRLDSQLILLEQNFMTKPSQLHLSMQVILLHTADNRAIAEATFYEQVPCQADTPYGGVMAANQATKKLTKRITQFVIDRIEHQPR